MVVAVGTFLDRAASLLTVRTGQEAPTTTLAPGVHPALIPPARSSALGEPRGLVAVYRSVQVLTTAAMQLPLTVERWGSRMDQAPSIITSPDPRMATSTWVTHMITSMALHGNAYALVERDAVGVPLALRPLNPTHVFVTVHPTTHTLRFSVEGVERPAADVIHAHLQPATIGEPFGLGPIQAARAELLGARDVRDYASQWFTGTGQPTGILSSPSATYAQAMATRNAWNGLDEKGEARDETPNPSGVKVLPSGFTYTPLSIAPKDAQWIEAQEFNVVQIARLFGIPSALIMASPSGGSMTYSNVEQDWTSFVRFTLMAYLRPLEDALTDVTVHGQTVRFNLDGLLRTDTATRYSSYSTALAAGFLTVDEVRNLEGRPPLTPATQEATA